MSALLEDLIVFVNLVEVQRVYADNIMHECKIHKEHDLYNKTRGIKDKCAWYIAHIKTSLPPEDAQTLDAEIAKIDPLDAITVLEHMLSIDTEKRAQFMTILKAIRDNKRVEVRIIESHE